MNKDAERECERLSGELGVTKELRSAMEWAYRDAAKFIRRSDWINNEIGDDSAERIAASIEERLT